MSITIQSEEAAAILADLAARTRRPQLPFEGDDFFKGYDLARTDVLRAAA